MEKEHAPHENVSVNDPNTIQEIAYAAGVDVAWLANQAHDQARYLRAEKDGSEGSMLVWEDAHIATKNLMEAAGVVFGPDHEGDPTVDRSYTDSLSI